MFVTYIQTNIHCGFLSLLIFQIASLKTYSNGYFRKQQNEISYFCGMTLFVDCTFYSNYNRKQRWVSRAIIYLTWSWVEWHWQWSKTFIWKMRLQNVIVIIRINDLKKFIIKYYIIYIVYIKYIFYNSHSNKIPDRCWWEI